VVEDLDIVSMQTIVYQKKQKGVLLAAQQNPRCAAST
jgi:hypothetical protein